MRRIWDVSLPLDATTPIYPGNPAFEAELRQSIERGDSANVSALRLGSHTGTHVDASRHFVAAGAGADELPLDVLIGPALLVDVPDVSCVTAADLGAVDLGAHTRLLVRTRNSSFIRTEPFRSDYTFIAPDAAEYLVEAGVRLIGVDYLSIEQFHSGHHRTHRTLLEAGVVIVEGLDLSAPPPGEYELICMPLRLTGLDGAPARAALIETERQHGLDQ